MELIDSWEGNVAIIGEVAPLPDGEEAWLAAMPTWAWWAIGAGGATLVLLGLIAVTRK